MRRTRARRAVLAVIALSLVVARPGIPAPSRSSPPPAYPGFGHRTTGGAGRPTFTVTTLADAGPGSLRAALERAARGGGTIRFAVGGGIHLESGLDVPGHTTVDGTSAPAPGITLWGARAGARGRGVVNLSASNVVLRGLRIRDGMNDGVQIVPRDGRPVMDVVVDHCSITGSRDGGIDVTGRDGLAVSDVTIVSSYLAGNGGPCGAALCGGGSLANDGATRLSFYYNLWDRNLRRTPSVAGPEAVADIRYNVVRATVQGGIQIRDGGRANLIDNTIEGARRQRAAVEKWGGRAHVDGTPSDVGGAGAIALLPVPRPPAAKSAALVVREAGAQPRDAVDASSISQEQAQRP